MAFCRKFCRLLSLILVLSRQTKGLNTKESVQYCQSREGKVGQATERCFGLRLKTSLPAGGLFNQHLTLLSAVTLGIATGAVELLIEQSPRRKDSMTSYKYKSAPLDSLWDTDHLRGFLEGHSISLLTGFHEGHPSVLPLAWFPSLLNQRKDISDAAYALRKHVLAQLPTLPGLWDKAGQQVPTIVEVAYPMGGTFMGLRAGQSEMNRDVAQHVLMAPKLRSLAQSCIDRMGKGNASYVGIHLRIEEDWARIGRSGGRESMLAHYLEALQRLGIRRDEQLYIASGIFATEPDFADQHLSQWPTRITHRTALLSSDELEGLDVEQLAAVDFLVVSQAAMFVGWQGSSFSFWVPEERALHGLDASTSLLIRSTEAMQAEHDGFAAAHGVAARSGLPS